MIFASFPTHFAGPPLHWHEKETEGFYILSGTITIQIEERVVKAPAGSFAFVPQGVVHTFSNQEDVTSTFLSLLSPAGFEGFIEELDVMMRQETTWPPPHVRDTPKRQVSRCMPCFLWFQPGRLCKRDGYDCFCRVRLYNL